MAMDLLFLSLILLGLAFGLSQLIQHKNTFWEESKNILRDNV